MIKLSAEDIQQTIVGGVPISSSDTAALSHFTFDPIGYTLSFQLKAGSVNKGAFTPSAHATPLFVKVDLSTGAYHCGNPKLKGPNGTLSATVLASLQNLVLASSNTLEALTTSLSLIESGTFAPR